jgi:hypothetical protein
MISRLAVISCLTSCDLSIYVDLRVYPPWPMPEFLKMLFSWNSTLYIWLCKSLDHHDHDGMNEM